jgi:Ala-tRNA(Pro) deacylase
MTIAMTVKDYLDDIGIEYDVSTHTQTSTNTQTARVADIPGEQLAKSVMLEDDYGHYMLAVLPSNRHVDLDKLHKRYRSDISLTPENKLGELFDDCVLGAIPATGEAYGFDVVWDDKLAECKDIHTTRRGFKKLMGKADHCGFTTLN